MEPAAAKQQVVDKVRQASNILVTVSANPTVDQLAACIGLTLLLNKMQKHATAVFSGQVPSTLEFLQPEKTLETNTDSLRDFIISLDKNKADKLRYKVEDQVVKIFITPYRTSLTDKDLVFSQGDFNVEAVIALGIKDRTQIDQAIAAHGKILHDATVISVNSGQGKAPDLGQINWQDPTASSLCEMLVSISEAFGGGLIDNQIATAFLTGIVAETNRFSNPKTSPKVMTMSAQLMAAGANQQLIVSKLDQPAVASPKLSTKDQPAELTPDGTLNVTHEVEATLEPAKAAPGAKVPESDEIHIDEQGNLKAAEELAKPLPAQPKEKDDKIITTAPQTPLEAMISTSEAPPAKAPETEKADLPGNHTLLNPENKQPVLESAFTANTEPEWQNPYDNVSMDPLGGDQPQVLQHKKTIQPLTPETAAKAGVTSPADVDAARNAVESALATAPFDPGFHPEQSAATTDAPAKTPESPTESNEPSLPLPLTPSSSAATDKIDAAAPPPVPPPLMTNGVVIPNPPASTSK